MCGGRNTWVQLSGDQRSWIHWSWSSEAVESCLTWVLGTELGFSWRTSQYSHWRTSPVPPAVLTCYTQLMIQRRLWGSGSHTEQKRQSFSFLIHQTSRNNSKGCFVPSSPKGCMHANFKFVNLRGSGEVYLVKRLSKVHQVRIYHLQPVRLQQGNFFKSNFKHNRVRKRCGCQKISKGSITGCQLLP